MTHVDVLVVGFGAAGASAAIAAQDAGARVLVAEKMPYGGGNCLNSGGFLFNVDGLRAVDHLDALCFGKTPRPVLEAFAAGMHELPAWLDWLGGVAAPVDLERFGGNAAVLATLPRRRGCLVLAVRAGGGRAARGGPVPSPARERRAAWDRLSVTARRRPS